VAGAATVAEARRFAENEEPGLAVIDLVVPDGDGITLLGQLRAAWPAMPAIILTGYVEPRSIVEAMRRGAVDYLTKPVDPDVFLSTCRTALARRQRPSVATRAEPLPILGQSAPTARVRDAVQRLARSRPAGVLIAGEDGVGKTWIAKALHAGSARRTAPCLAYACADGYQPAVDLFGVAGTTASGLLAGAHGGSVILDDVDALSSDVQLQFLALSEGAPPGAPLLIGLTRGANATGPLLGWLGRAIIEIAPLRDRTTDVLPLAGHFLTERGAALGRRFDGFTRLAEQHLLRHPWPGNVHELREVVRRAATLAAGGSVQPEHLQLGGQAAALPPWAATGDPRPLREIEEAYIDHVLAVTRGNKTRAARLLGVARETLRTRMRSRATTPCA
jgi:DNA-binding NtrC family response regulator